MDSNPPTSQGLPGRRHCSSHRSCERVVCRHLHHPGRVCEWPGFSKCFLPVYAPPLGILSFTIPQMALQAEQDSHSVAGVDPRLVVDCDNNTPFAVARLHRRFELLPLLNPATPLIRLGLAGPAL